MCDIETLFIVGDAAIPNVDAARVVSVTESVMKKITGLDSVSASTVAAEVTQFHPADFEEWEPGQLQRLLVLERNQDPGNMGTLLRTALALGWQGAFLLQGCADPMNEKSLRASRAAPFRLPIAQGTIDEWLAICDRHGMVRLAADPHPASKDQRDQLAGTANGTESTSDPPVCLVLGNEGQGLSEDVLRHCLPVAIPMPGEMESLNVAAAGAILMFMLSQGAPQLVGDLDNILNGRSDGNSIR